MRNTIILAAATATALAGACAGDDAACPADRDCTGITCGVDPVCGMLCDFCPPSQTCNSLAGRCEGGTVCGDSSCNGGETCASCSRDCGACPFCGDGSCNAGETCTSCEADCGTCGGCTSVLCTSGSFACCPSGRAGTWNYAVARCDCGGCTTSPDCGATEVCAAGSCESAWNRLYRITAVSGVYPAGSWDTDGSRPDPYVEFTVNGATASTRYIDNTLTPTWNQYTDATLTATSTFGFTVYDDDYGFDDVLSSVASRIIDVVWLHSTTVNFAPAGTGASTTFTFEPL